MSTYQAVIAGAGSTLKALLKDRMATEPGDNEVRLGPPPADNPAEGVNLFLYRLTENAALKNQDLLTGHPSSYGKPPLALNLHYLLTAYGGTENGSEVAAHRLLDDAMRVLHEYPIISDRLVERRSGQVGNPLPLLDPALRGQHEPLRITMEPLSLDDLSKIWTSLSQPLRLGGTYIVQVVQVRNQRLPRLAPPVRDLSRQAAPRVYVVPFQHPRVDRVEPALAEVGEPLVVHGTNLDRALLVRLGGVEIPVGAASDDRLSVPVPGETTADGTPLAPDDQLRAGTHPVQVVSVVAERADRRLDSNVAAFVLIPTIEQIEVRGAPLGPNAEAKEGDEVVVTTAPRVHREDRPVLFVGSIGVPADPDTFASGSGSVDTVRFTVPGPAEVPARPEPYALRLRVNGAESRYDLVGDPPEPKWKLRITA